MPFGKIRQRAPPAVGRTIMEIVSDADQREQMNSLSYTIRLLGPSDTAVFEKVAPGVFYKPADASLTAEFLNDPRHHIAVALSEGEIIGSATATHYLHPSRPPTLFIIGVAVSPAFRRLGVGKAMLHSLLEEARKLGCTEAKVGAEVSNGAAQSLYSGIGGALDPDDYVTYTIDLKKEAAPPRLSDAHDQ
jgi:ribosomal protein S18 acetylase RimI-like enzyme